MEKVIGILDMRAFYAYVECVDRKLDPYSTPLVVADKDRGKNTIVLSVSPYLKAHGVPSRLRINDLPAKFNYVYAVPRMELYMRKSAEVIQCILEFVSMEDIHIYSVDEAFINIGPYLKYYRLDSYSLILKIKNHIKKKLGLEATAGLGDNMFLAKVALDVYAKKEKNGIATLFKEDIKTKLWPITPLIKIWGIGPNIERKLNQLGIYNMEDLAKADETIMVDKFKSLGKELIKRANGIDESNIREVYIPKDTSLTQGQTLFRNYDKEEMRLIIKETLDELCFRMRRHKVVSDVVSIFIGYSKDLGGFATQLKLLRYSNLSEDLLEPIMNLYNKNIEDKPIRHISIAVSHLKEDKGIEQCSLFEDIEQKIKRKNLQKAIDDIHNSFGPDSILRASALSEKSTIKQRHSQIGGHKR